MDNAALFVLAGYDDAAGARLDALQDRLYERGFVGVQTKDIPPHITLGSYLDDREQEMFDRLHRVSAETVPFDVQISHIGLFAGGRVLFAAPDIAPSLLALRGRFSDSADAFEWVPHSTLLIDEPDVIYRALPVTVENFSPFRATVNKLYLFRYFAAEQRADILLTAPFTGQSR